jgi:hypothetical protein
MSPLPPPSFSILGLSGQRSKPCNGGKNPVALASMIQIERDGVANKGLSKFQLFFRKRLAAEAEREP